MPGVRLIELPAGPPPRRRVSEPERAQARDQLRQACQTGRPVELTLHPDERASSIRLRYRPGP